MVAAVAHHQFEMLTCEQRRQLLEPSNVLVELKGIVPRQLGALRL